jgi:hypothetical protein
MFLTRYGIDPKTLPKDIFNLFPRKEVRQYDLILEEINISRNLPFSGEDWMKRIGRSLTEILCVPGKLNPKK